MLKCVLNNHRRLSLAAIVVPVAELLIFLPVLIANDFSYFVTLTFLFIFCGTILFLLVAQLIVMIVLYRNKIRISLLCYLSAAFNIALLAVAPIIERLF